MCVWCGKSGYDFGIGKSAYSIRSRDVLMCSERYAADIPLRFLNTQMPPTRSDFSKQSKSNAALVQRLGGRDAGRAGADHADLGEPGHVMEAGKR